MQLLCERLRTLCEGLKMTQYQVGEILDIPQTSIHRYEIGAYTQTTETLVWHVDFFDVSMGVRLREKIGFMPQYPGMYGNFTAEKFLWYMAALKGMKKEDAAKSIP